MHWPQAGHRVCTVPGTTVDAMDTTALFPPAPPTAPPTPTTTTPRPRSAPADRAGSPGCGGAGDRPRLGPAGPARPARRHRGPALLGAHRQRLGQRVLLRRRPGRRASWKAFFFGSSDAANSITVDKPPASLWVMALSVRVFGLSSWSILVPAGARWASPRSGCCYATVARTSAPAAGLLAGAVLALTPVAVLMFRFNNPDALLVLLLVAAAPTPRVARHRAGRAARWLVLAGVLVGLGFLTKMLQAFLVVPAFALVYLVAAPTPLRGSGSCTCSRPVGAMVVSAGWWIAIVELVPGLGPPLHRRLAEQLDPRADPRLQRPRPAHRQRDRLASAAAAATGRRHVGRDRADPDVQRRDRRPDRLAAPGRADPAGRRACGARGRTPRTDRAPRGATSSGAAGCSSPA